MSTPGWYPDPAGSSNVRYWDGAQWTDHLAPPPHAAAALPSEQLAPVERPPAAPVAPPNASWEQTPWNQQSSTWGQGATGGVYHNPYVHEIDSPSLAAVVLRAVLGATLVSAAFGVGWFFGVRELATHDIAIGGLLGALVVWPAAAFVAYLASDRRDWPGVPACCLAVFTLGAAMLAGTALGLQGSSITLVHYGLSLFVGPYLAGIYAMRSDSRDRLGALRLLAIAGGVFAFMLVGGLLATELSESGDDSGRPPIETACLGLTNWVQARTAGADQATVDVFWRDFRSWSDETGDDDVGDQANTIEYLVAATAATQDPTQRAAIEAQLDAAVEEYRAAYC